MWNRLRQQQMRTHEAHGQKKQEGSARGGVDFRGETVMSQQAAFFKLVKLAISAHNENEES